MNLRNLTSIVMGGSLLLGIPGTPAAAGAPRPDAALIQADLERLCCEAWAGRRTGTDGEVEAAAFLARRMAECGLLPIVPGGLGGATPFHHPWHYRGEDPEAHRHPAAPSQGPSGAPAKASSSNVVGIVRGVDPALKGEFVFLTAHFDHLGIQAGRLYPGADDNASGTAGLLEVMRLLKGARPARTLAFLFVSGEEEGLLGSEAFLADPPVPLASIVADINMDMVGRGRVGELHVMPARREGYVTTLTRDARELALAQGIPLSAGIEPFWRQSDHYTFARRSIPALCFNTGLHADWHRPTDTPEKIDYAKLVAVTTLVRDLALRTASAPAAPVVLPRSVWEAWVWGPYDTPNFAPIPEDGCLALP